MTIFPLRVWLLPLLLLALGAPLWLHWFEPAAFIAINRWCAHAPDAFWTALSLFGSGWGALGLVAPLLVLAPRLFWACLCTMPLAAVLVRGGKLLIESPRPAAEVAADQIRIVGESMHSASMPSGHTLTAFAMASALYFALPAQRRASYAWVWLLAAGTGLSRMALGAHWPGDVAAGASLGLLSGLLGNVLAARMGPAHCRPRAWSLRLAALLLVANLYYLLFDVVDFPQSLMLQYLLAAVVAATLLVFGWQSLRPEKHRHSPPAG